MDLSKLPPFVAMSLGLVGCIVGPCLSPVDPPFTGSGSSGPCLSPPHDGTSGTTDASETFTTSACLGPPLDTTASSSDTGSGSDSGSGSGSGSDSGSGSGSGSDSGTSSGGGMAVEPVPPTRAAAVERMHARGTLPADVLDRLRALTSTSKG